MDRRSWLWRRKSSEKSPGETESSGSVSSHSERYSDDQEALRASPNDNMTIHAQSPEVSSNTCDTEAYDTVKSLTEKLSAALLNISAKEDLVKQHAKVAEEAVSGWEQAEAEVAALKQQLEISFQKNSALDEKITQLDGALKECVRQLHQSREEQEEKLHYSITKKMREWESEKHMLEKQLVKLKAQLEAAKTEAGTFDHGIQGRLEAVEKENMALKAELHSQSEDLRVLFLERELSNKAAETASKQHLDSIKKVTKLEAECHQLRSTNRRLSSVNDHKPIANSVCVESLTDSQSDIGERLLGMDNEPGCSGSWASALITELDQFKGEKANSRILAASPIEIELMDDFLEMEKLVGLPETNHQSSDFEPEADSNQVIKRDIQPKVDNEILYHKLIELEEKIERLEHEKSELEKALAESHNRFEESCNQLTAAENKMVELQTNVDLANESKQIASSEVMNLDGKMKELEIALAESNNRLEASSNQLAAAENKMVELQTNVDLANESKQIATGEVTNLEGKIKELETQLESAYLENGKLCEKLSFLEGRLEAERVLSVELKARIEIAEAARQALDSQLKSAHFELSSLSEMVGLLECQVKEEKAISSDLSAKLEALEATRKALESQLEHAHLEVRKLQEKISILELKAQEERMLYAESATNLEAVEAAKKKLELELNSAHEFATIVEAAEASKKLLEIQLESAHAEVAKLRDKVASLEKKIDEERVLSAEFEAKCHKLEDDLWKIKRETDLWRATNSNQQLKIKQEKELVVAARKLEECQKTIASLNRQLKSLTNLDDFMLEVEKPEHNGGLQDLSGDEAKDLHHNGYNLPNGRERGSPQSSLSLLSSYSSNLPGFIRSLSHSRSISR